MPDGRTCGGCSWWRAWSPSSPRGYGDCRERSNPMPEDPTQPQDRLKHHGSSAAERCPRYNKRKAVAT